MAQSATSEPTVRITVDVSKPVHDSLVRTGDDQGLSLRHLCTRALSSVVSPPLSLLAGDDPRFQQFPEFIQGAREIVVLGTSLWSICRAGLAHDKVLELIGSDQPPRITLALYDPAQAALAPSPGAPMVDTVERRRGYGGQGALAKELEVAKGFLREAVALANSRGHDRAIEVLATRELPTFGLTIVNPYRADARIRVSLYTHKYPDECDPVLHILPSSMGDQHAYALFYRHYEGVVRDSAPFVL